MLNGLVPHPPVAVKNLEWHLDAEVPLWSQGSQPHTRAPVQGSSPERERVTVKTMGIAAEGDGKLLESQVSS